MRLLIKTKTLPPTPTEILLIILQVKVKVKTKRKVKVKVVVQVQAQGRGQHRILVDLPQAASVLGFESCNLFLTKGYFSQPINHLETV